MQPNNTAAVQIWSGYLIFNGTTWEQTIGMNTLGDISATNTTSQINITSGNLFTLNKTNISAYWYRYNVAIPLSIVNLTDTTIGCYMANTIAAGDKLLLKIEVYNNADINVTTP